MWFIRQIVSMQRKRYTADGYDLDLSYITPRLLAMCYPADSGLEVMYRNPMWQVERFLDSKHRDTYKVFNLCSEQCYSMVHFKGRVERFPFDDHDVPPLALVRLFCQKVQQWLDEGPHNVAAIHCRAGKGRTGLMVCCYLVTSGYTADEALALYAKERTTDDKGVTISSQRRYVHYWEQYLRPRTDTSLFLSGTLRAPPTPLTSSFLSSSLGTSSSTNTGNASITPELKDLACAGANASVNSRVEPAHSREIRTADVGLAHVATPSWEGDGASCGVEGALGGLGPTAEALELMDDIPRRVERVLRRMRLYGVAAASAGGPDVLDFTLSVFVDTPDENRYRRRVVRYAGICRRPGTPGLEVPGGALQRSSSYLWMMSWHGPGADTAYQLSKDGLMDPLGGVPASRSAPPRMLVHEGRSVSTGVLQHIQAQMTAPASTANPQGNLLHRTISRDRSRGGSPFVLPSPRDRKPLFLHQNSAAPSGPLVQMYQASESVDLNSPSTAASTPSTGGPSSKHGLSLSPKRSRRGRKEKERREKEEKEDRGEGEDTVSSLREGKEGEEGREGKVPLPPKGAFHSLRKMSKGRGLKGSFSPRVFSFKSFKSSAHGDHSGELETGDLPRDTSRKHVSNLAPVPPGRSTSSNASHVSSVGSKQRLAPDTHEGELAGEGGAGGAAQSGAPSTQVGAETGTSKEDVCNGGAEHRNGESHGAVGHTRSSSGVSEDCLGSLPSVNVSVSGAGTVGALVPHVRPVYQLETERPTDPNMPVLEHEFDPPQFVAGDVLLKVYTGALLAFKACFNTAYVTKGMLCLRLEELDKVNPRFKSSCNKEAFLLEIVFGQECPPGPPSGLLSPAYPF